LNSLYLCLFEAVLEEYLAELTNIILKISGICLAGILVILLGKYEQKKRMPLWVKLVLQSLIALLVISVGIKIEFLRNSSGGYWYLTNLSVPVTIIWLVSITNSVGQTDELGDITPVIVFIASLTFLIVSLFQRQGLVLAEILSVLLVVFSFIIIILKKKDPGRKGSYFSAYYMFFGFMLAIIAIVGVLKSTAALTLLTPLLILGFPIVDTSYSFITIFLGNDYLGTINESRLRQQLINQGFSWQGANMVIVTTCIYLSLIAVVISIWENFYLFTAMIGAGYIAFFWLRQVVQGQNIIHFDANKQRVELFGVPIDKISSQQAMERLSRFVTQKNSCYVVTPDTLAILRARKDIEYLEITKKASLVTPDGAGLLWATTTLDNPLIERITGIDLINQICQLAVKKKYSLYLLGAKEEVIKEAAENLRKKYQGIDIVGYHHGYFDCNEDKYDHGNNIGKEIVKQIKKKRPDFLLVGMGVPKQEFWISKHKDELGVPVCIGIGGSFDVLSGKIPRAPLWMQNHGMEWIFRLIKEPKRIKRAVALPYFMWLILLGKIELFFRVDE
jgi:exopolysaccharide biosynthesis WecB/TagA/CpsF family protein